MKKLSAFIIVGVLVIIAILCAILLNKNYTVTFDSNGGSLVKSVEVKKNEKVDKPSDPTREGYEFSGWYLDEKLFDFNTKITENITLTAKWKNTVTTYKVTFDSNGGSAVDAIFFENGIIKDLPTPTKDGYKFLGWYLNGEKLKNGSKITSDAKVVAKWQKIDEKAVEYTVTFDFDNENSSAQVKVIKDTTIAKPNDPTKDGYKFLGWYLNGVLYDFNLKVTKDITLVAKWEKLEVKKEDNKPEETKDVISYLQEDIKTSIVGQTTLYVTKNGEKVDGYLDITVISGETITKKITKEGYVTNKNQIKSISNARLEK